MVQHYQIPVLEIEPVELVARLFGVGDVLVDDKDGAFGVVGGALADLADGAEFAEEVEEFVRGDVVAVSRCGGLGKGREGTGEMREKGIEKGEWISFITEISKKLPGKV